VSTAGNHRVYVASPLGFTVPTRAYYNDVLLPALSSRGLEPLDPWSCGDEVIREILQMPPGPLQDDAWSEFAARHAAGVSLKEYLGSRNAALIDQAGAIFAVLDGTDVDSGTAAEIGYGAARGKPVVAWRSDLRLSADNAAALVNLQVEYFILMNKGGYAGRELTGALDALCQAVGLTG
jgi:nucleoside 2-deoxyribosyltransferase